MTKKTLTQSCRIFLLASILGCLVNSFHPRRVKISFSRPPIEFAADDSSSQILPSITIDDLTQDKKLAEPVTFTKAQIIELLKNNSIVLIDARSFDEFKQGHIPGAISLPYHSSFENKASLNKLPKDKWLATYCDGPPCDVAELLAYEFLYAGFNKVGVYTEGLIGWKSEIERKK